MQSKIAINNIRIQQIVAGWLPKTITLHIARFDEVHPVVSGNKWFKLKYYLADAQQRGYNTIATFGGAYSNHIVAAAFAAQACGLNSIGIIRGEQPASPSLTLQHAQQYGMQLHYISRQEFNNKELLKQQYPNAYCISEGGYGTLGAKGAAEILLHVPDLENHTHIVCAVGTGTMLAGLVNSALPHQKVIGVSVLKNNFSITDEVTALLTGNAGQDRFTIEHGYHFGGYAKHPPQLIEFMQQAWQTTALPTDIVYTAKVLFAIQQMALNNTIPQGSRVLMVHSGGLQGNSSLQKGLLPF